MNLALSAVEATEARSQLHQALLSRRHAIADEWHKAIARTSFAPFKAVEMRQRLIELTEDIIALLLTESFDHHRAQAIGASLARFHYLEPEALGGTQEVLAQQLIGGLTADQIVELQPRLTALLGGLATGFSRQARQTVLAEQEWIHGALARELRRAEEAMRRERDLAEALAEAAAVVNSSLDSDQVLDRILEQVSRVVPNDAANIILIEDNQARIVRWRGYECFGAAELIRTVVFRAPETHSFQQMAKSGKPVVILDAAAFPGQVHVPGMEWVRSYAAAPIVIHDQVIGFLNVDSATPGFFTQDHVEALRAFADHAAAAIANARLYDKVQQELAERKRAEEELRISEEKYRDLVENVEDIIYAFDENGIITYVSPATKALSGYTPSEVIGRHIMEFVYQEESSLFRESFQRSLARGPSTPIDFRLLTKSGEIRWVRIHSRVVLEEDRIIGFRGVMTDITERKRAEEKLRESEERYRTLFERVPVGLYRTTPEGQILDVNPALLEMLGFPNPETALGVDTASGYVNPEDRARWQALMDSEGIVRDFEAQWRRHDGMVIWVKDTARAVRDGEGRVLYYEGSLEDVTERRQVEQELLRLSSAVKTSVDSIVIIDVEGKIIDANEAALKLYGADDKGDLIGQHILDLTAPEHREKGLAGMEFVLEKGYDTSRGYDAITRDGRRIPVELSAAVMKDADGKLIGIVIIARDITERKQADERIRTYQERLRSLASELSLTEERERRRLAAALHDHIAQTLALSKIKLGVVQGSVSSIDLAQSLDEIYKLIEQVIRDMRSLTFEISPPILYELGLAAAVGWLTEQTQKQHGIPSEFWDDKQPKPLDEDVQVLLYQAVRELLINVVKHAQTQHVKVSMRRDNTQMRIAVEDNGVGFDSSDISSPWSKAEGFGLFSIRERLDIIGGHLEIESQPGHGTRVTLVAPLAGEHGA